MTRKSRGHTLTKDEAMDLLHNHVQFCEGDSRRVEMPLADLMAKFDISYPLNLAEPDYAKTPGMGLVVNGFSKEAQPEMVNFYLKKLAAVAGISEEEAHGIVTGNHVQIDVTHTSRLRNTGTSEALVLR